MIEWFQGVWPLISHIGLGGGAIATLLAAAYFSPILKREFVYAAAGVALALFIYGVGVHDEKVKRDAQLQEITKQVHDATKNAILSGEKDPYDNPSN